MTRLLLAAQSGWGKSYLAQNVIETNLPNYDSGLILDYKDEYRGVAEEGVGPAAAWKIAGPDELALEPSDWADGLESNPAMILPRHRLRDDQWRDLAAAAIAGARRLSGSCLVVIDEAHFVAPQSGSYPEVISGLATTGRGERVSSIWVTQRLSEIDKTVVTQCNSRLLGGFEGDEVDRVAEAVSGYPADLHDPQAVSVSVPDDLLAEDGAGPLRLFTDAQDRTLGSEWIYSDSSGERRRIDTRGMDMETDHYSPEGEPIEI